MRKAFVLIGTEIFLFHLVKCSTEVNKKEKQFMDFVNSLKDNEEYNNYNFFWKIFGRRGIIMEALNHKRDLECKEEIIRSYVKYNANKERTNIELIQLIGKMIDKGYKLKQIEEFLKNLNWIITDDKFNDFWIIFKLKA